MHGQRAVGPVIAFGQPDTNIGRTARVNPSEERASPFSGNRSAGARLRETCERPASKDWATDHRGVLRGLRETEDVKSRDGEGDFAIERGCEPARARATERRGVRTTNSSSGQPDDGERGHDKLGGRANGRRERRAPNAVCGQPQAASVDATELSCGAPQESPPSRRQTHRVGNQAVRAAQSKLIRVAQPGGESVVGRGCGSSDRSSDSSRQARSTGNRGSRAS
jgi:hypothetical protein